VGSVLEVVPRADLEAKRVVEIDGDLDQNSGIPIGGMVKIVYTKELLSKVPGEDKGKS